MNKKLQDSINSSIKANTTQYDQIRGNNRRNTIQNMFYYNTGKDQNTSKWANTVLRRITGSVDFSNPMSARINEQLPKAASNAQLNKEVGEATPSLQQSTAIENLQYVPIDGKHGKVYVRFKGDKKGTAYEFPDVPLSAVRAWMRTPSKGRGYWNNIQQYSINK